ncbi:MAG: hypothetical protein ACNS60_07695 [Candidatus Cyclobacteriaceae bacterium M2_1C_046]
MTKLLKLVWFFSLFAGLGALLWTYASVSYDVKVLPETIIGRETFFYISLFVLSALNFLLYGLSTQEISSHKPFIKGWEYSFGTIFNAFFTTSVLFINIFNSNEPFRYNYFGYLIVVFLGMMILWLVALPLMILFSKKS